VETIKRRQFVRTVSTSSLTRILCGVPQGVGPWTDPVLVHCWLATTYWGPWSLPSSVCRWHPSLWALSSVCNSWASQHLAEASPCVRAIDCTSALACDEQRCGSCSCR